MTVKNAGIGVRPRPVVQQPDEELWLGLTRQNVYRVAGGIAAFGVLLIVLAAIGFGRSKATVTGRVTHKGRPVIWGSVLLVGADGRAASGRIEPDGSYAVTNAPQGEVQVGVISKDPLVQHYATQIKTQRERVALKKWEALPVDRRQWFPLPPQYEDPKTSGLATTISRGSNQYEINLP